METFFKWLMLLAIGFIAVMTPIIMVAAPLAGVKMSVGLYVVGFVELALIIIFVAYKVLDKKCKQGELKQKMIPTSVAACVVSFVLALSLSPLYKFEGGKSSSYSSSTSYDSNSSYGYKNRSTSSGGSGGSSSSTTYRSTTKPQSTPYTGQTTRSRYTPKPQRTVNPEDHDIESYYLDYQDEFEDEDDAWDDFEDDPDVWDDY